MSTHFQKQDVAEFVGWLRAPQFAGSAVLRLIVSRRMPLGTVTRD